MDTPTICLVGKGLTFDSGGLSLKPANAMETMKSDMGGAAAVLGAMQAVAELKLPLHVVGLVSAAENMPSSDSYRPGDIVRTLSGKTIEVLNTDAEGRLILADALFYAQRYKPAAIVELSTLTGAIVIALGTHAIGMMGTDQALADQLSRAVKPAASGCGSSPSGTVPRDGQERDRRSQEPCRVGGWFDHSRRVPRGLRGRLPLRAPRHRRHGMGRPAIQTVREPRRPGAGVRLLRSSSESMRSRRVADRVSCRLNGRRMVSSF